MRFYMEGEWQESRWTHSYRYAGQRAPGVPRVAAYGRCKTQRTVGAASGRPPHKAAWQLPCSTTLGGTTDRPHRGSSRRPFLPQVSDMIDA